MSNKMYINILEKRNKCFLRIRIKSTLKQQIAKRKLISMQRVVTILNGVINIVFFRDFSLFFEISFITYQ